MAAERSQCHTVPARIRPRARRALRSPGNERADLSHVELGRGSHHDLHQGAAAACGTASRDVASEVYTDTDWHRGTVRYEFMHGIDNTDLPPAPGKRVSVTFRMNTSGFGYYDDPKGGAGQGQPELPS